MNKTVFEPQGRGGATTNNVRAPLKRAWKHLLYAAVAALFLFPQSPTSAQTVYTTAGIPLSP